MIRCDRHDETYPAGNVCKLCAIGAPSIAETERFLAGTQTKYLLAELEKRRPCEKCVHKQMSPCDLCIFNNTYDNFSSVKAE